MATVTVGDIHGNLRALNHLLLKLQVNITPGDTVVFLSEVPSVRGTDPGSSPEMTHLGHALNTYSF